MAFPKHTSPGVGTPADHRRFPGGLRRNLVSKHSRECSERRSRDTNESPPKQWMAKVGAGPTHDFPHEHDANGDRSAGMTERGMEARTDASKTRRPSESGSLFFPHKAGRPRQRGRHRALISAAPIDDTKWRPELSELRISESALENLAAVT